MSSIRPELKLDWCSHSAAKYAVEHWHYSKSLPVPPHVRVGVWEGGKFIGCVIFSRGASTNILVPFGLRTTEGCELSRVALTAHVSPTSRIVRIAVRLMVRKCPGIRLIVSFADPSEGHVGGIYQAMGWVYAGMTAPTMEYIDRLGKQWHGRMVSPSGLKKVFGKYRKVLKPSECTPVKVHGKHRYVMPLDAGMKDRVGPSKPYPKKSCAGSADGGTSGSQPEGGGSIPTSALTQ